MKMSKITKTAICLAALAIILWVNSGIACADYGFSPSTKSDYGFEQTKKSDYGYIEASNHTSATDIKTGYSPNACYTYYYGAPYYYNSPYYCNNGYYLNPGSNRYTAAQAPRSQQYQYNNKTGNPQTLYQMFNNK